MLGVSGTLRESAEEVLRALTLLNELGKRMLQPHGYIAANPKPWNRRRIQAYLLGSRGRPILLPAGIEACEGALWEVIVVLPSRTALASDRLTA